MFVGIFIIVFSHMILLVFLFFQLLQKAAYEERLRRKLELQKQKSAEANKFSAGLKAELGKQKEMKSKTKEERRNALCEELGRGC